MQHKCIWLCVCVEKESLLKNTKKKLCWKLKVVFGANGMEN